MVAIQDATSRLISYNVKNQQINVKLAGKNTPHIRTKVLICKDYVIHQSARYALKSYDETNT